MVSPVWYNIRRIGTAKYEISGEHDVDVSWMQEVRGHDSGGEIVGRILPRFAVDQWDKQAYQELISNKDAIEELARIILEQVRYFPLERIAEFSKYDFDGIVVELAIPQYLEVFLTYLADKIHSMSGQKRIIVVIPPNVPSFPSAEVFPIATELMVEFIQSRCSC